MNSPKQQRSVVLFAHGSRDPLWHRPVEAVARTLTRDQPDLQVRCAYLELSTPDLASACRELIEADCLQISVVPLFLGVGRHAREDLPLLVEQLRAQYPKVEFALKPAVGEDPRLIALLADIASE